ncbi:MAG: hypothetical protein IPN32_37440 [Deltaproteobacteria bacterium]|nr:hypothetical protein [Deltaproteobacteria bacterium]
MFIVSGTKRSGTSMWMQTLVAAGFEVEGVAFPKNWGAGSLRDANPDGFYEGLYRDGIFFGTNPHPETGAYVRPEQTRGRVTKVFIPGVVRTELGFIDGVVANVRAWRDYEASVARLWALEDQQRAVEAPDDPIPMRVPGALEWWSENFSLLRDQAQRGYPMVLQTYEQVLADPEPYVRRVIELAGGGNVEAAVAAVKPESRTQRASHSDAIEPRIAQIFDELHGAIERRTPIEGAFLRLLVETNRELQPRLLDIKFERTRKMVLAGSPPPPLFMMAAAMG